MCTTSTSMKLDLVKLFATVLQGSVKPMITQCCIVELYKLGPSEQSSVDLAKSFERRKCNHREAIAGEECIASVVGDKNKHRYVIACQSHAMRVQLRGVPGVPIVHLNRSVMVLEPPSDATLTAKRAAEDKALLPPAQERDQLATGTEQPQRKRRNGPKAPNPLSVKKKKVRSGQESLATAGVKRKRDEDLSSEHVDSKSRPKRKRRKKMMSSNGPE